MERENRAGVVYLKKKKKKQKEDILVFHLSVVCEDDGLRLLGALLCIFSPSG